jgi:hypothetical protein
MGQFFSLFLALFIQKDLSVAWLITPALVWVANSAT